MTFRKILLMVAAAAIPAAQAVPQRAGRQPPVITAFALDDGADIAVGQVPVVLTHTVVGATPSAYRVSARADFVRAVWQSYLARPTLAGWESLAIHGCEIEGTKEKLILFFQVRASLGDEVRIVNGQRRLVPVMAESNVLSDSICVGAR